MEYFRLLFQLFVNLFNQACSFTNIILLFIVSGVIGGIVNLLKLLIQPQRSSNGY